MDVLMNDDTKYISFLNYRKKRKYNLLKLKIKKSKNCLFKVKKIWH